MEAEIMAMPVYSKPKLLVPIRHRGPAAQAGLSGIRARDVLVAARIQLVNHVRGTVEFQEAGFCDTATNWRVALRFKSGLAIDFAGDPMPEEWRKRYPAIQSHGTAFEGSEGWVHVNRGAINSHPEGIAGSKIASEASRLYQRPGHVRNFLDCIKSREPAVCDIDEAVRSETLCQVSEIAIRLGRKVKWDPATETFPGDAEANRRLKRPMRSPWSLAGSSST